LYDATSRRAAWRRLVDEAVPDFVDSASNGPLAGREDQWSLVTDYRVRLASDEHDWAEAERLQRLCVDWDRQRAEPALAAARDRRDGSERNAIRTLAVSLQALADIQREQGRATCVAAYREALDLGGAIGDAAVQAVCAFNLGRAYRNIADLRNLDEAERWYRQSLDLFAPDDRLGRGRCVGQLGLVAYERFLDAQTAKRPFRRFLDALTGKRRPEELAGYLAEAARLYQQALDMMPATAVTERGTIHGQLGVIHRNAGDIDRALHHYQQAIRYFEQAGDIFGAGQTRYNVGLALLNARRPSDARAYAEAALANFATFGDRAADHIQQTERLIAAIDQALAQKPAGP
jgi:tetratricopeptide (TPR) repeat protein